jgi:flagellar biosynthetic protein FliR
MSTILDASAGELPFFLLTFFRVAGVLMIAPVFGSQMLPPTVKVFLALLVAVLFFPTVDRAGRAVPADALAYAGAAGGELAVGLLIGFAAALVFAAVQFGGQIIDQELGIMMANILDPMTSEQVSIIGQFKLLLATIVYLLIDGHHFLIDAVGRSFASVPLLGLRLGGGSVTLLSDTMMRDVFRMAVQIAAPALVTLFLVTLALAFMARTVPEMNIFVLGFAVRILVGFLVLAVGVGLFVHGFKGMNSRGEDGIRRLVGFLGGA